MPRTETELTKIGVAIDQLDWAMRLVLDHQAFVPAITLAGAAEEILGKLLGGRPTAHQQIKRSFSGGDHGVSDKELSDEYLNKARNWFKHHADPSGDTIILELETEAVGVIVRAQINLLEYDQSRTSESPRFDAWVATRGALA